MSDEIEEIRERHTMYPPSRPSSSSRYSFIVAYQNIATLLAEVDRRGAEIAALRAKIDRFRRNEREYDAAIGTAAAILPGTGQNYAFSFPLRGMQMVVEQFKAQRAENEKLRADNERLFNEDTKTRHALKGWVFVCPDGGDEPTHERVAAVVAEVENLRAEIERLREVIRTIRARCVELDDSDAVSETLDIATAVLEDEP